MRRYCDEPTSAGRSLRCFMASTLRWTDRHFGHRKSHVVGIIVTHCFFRLTSMSSSPVSGRTSGVFWSQCPEKGFLFQTGVENTKDSFGSLPKHRPLLQASSRKLFQRRPSEPTLTLTAQSLSHTWPVRRQPLSTIAMMAWTCGGSLATNLTLARQLL